MSVSSHLLMGEFSPLTFTVILIGVFIVILKLFSGCFI